MVIIIGVFILKAVKWFRNLWMKEMFLLFMILIFVLLLISFLTPKFLTLRNLFLILQTMSELQILALGGTLIIMIGGFDLSITAVSALTGVITGGLMLSGFNIITAIIIGLVFSMLAGLLNGFLIAKIGVNSIICTIGTSALFVGIALVLTAGRSFSGFPSAYLVIGQGSIGKISFQTIVFIVVAIVTFILVKKSIWGRNLVIIGSNITVAKFSGINVVRNLIFAFVFASFLGGVSGIIISSRVATAKADLGSAYLMLSIAAILVGGTDLYGGRAEIGGTILGASIFTILANGLNIMGVSHLLQQLLSGLILIGVIILRSQITRLKEKSLIKDMGKNIKQ